MKYDTGYADGFDWQQQGSGGPRLTKRTPISGTTRAPPAARVRTYRASKAEKYNYPKDTSPLGRDYGGINNGNWMQFAGPGLGMDVPRTETLAKPYRSSPVGDTRPVAVGHQRHAGDLPSGQPIARWNKRR